MNNYLAKSYPRETIAEHTDRLLESYDILRSLYPFLRVNWELLRFACLYHDLGKINKKFQSKIEGIKVFDDEIAHNMLSLAFIDPKFLKEKYLFTDADISLLAQAVAYHHDRGDYDDIDDNAIESLKEDAEGFIYPKIILTRIKPISARYFSNNRVYGNSKNFLDYVEIKGLLNRLDYAASAHICVEVGNDFLLQGLNGLKYKWNELQKFMLDQSGVNVIAVAQTGMGKTEAGLLWIGNNKGFFTLPLRTAINAIYKRITEDIAGIENREKVGLLHSDTYSKYLEYASEESDTEVYYNKTRQLSLPLTVCTLDQIFDFVFRYRDFEPKLATLSYSRIIIDEVQMYSPDLLAYLILGLYYIDRVGGKFAVLTATLPEIFTDLLRKENIKFILPPKPFINDIVRHSVKVVESEIKSPDIADNYNNNRILVICNTVKKAQCIYNELRSDPRLSSAEINLIHSKFIKKDRREKETAIIETGRKNSQNTGIWVATQVVEASLDIDFDFLFTELSDANGLFQRMGRCFRSREFSLEGYNCFVYNGGKAQCSGVGYNIDEQIFELSKEALKNVNGKITESEKLAIIGNIYTTDKLKNTDYYRKVTDNIEYVKNIPEYDLSKADVRDRFRNIDNVTIMPEIVYNDNKETVDRLVAEINRIQNENESRAEYREERIRNIYKLRDFTADIRRDEFLKLSVLNRIAVSKYEEIPVVSCEYTFEEGIVIERRIRTDNENFDARCF